MMVGVFGCGKMYYFSVMVNKLCWSLLDSFGMIFGDVDFVFNCEFNEYEDWFFNNVILDEWIRFDEIIGRI